MSATGGVLFAALVLTACSAPVPVATNSPDESPTVTTTTTPTVTPSPTPTAPVLHPSGTAEENLPFFTSIVEAVWGTPEQVHGRAYIDALVAGGFDKAAMQVTLDRTTVDEAADSIQFSVQWGSKCLVGQVGPSTGAPFTTIVPVLADGVCLIGKTRPIDW